MNERELPKPRNGKNYDREEMLSFFDRPDDVQRREFVANFFHYVNAAPLEPLLLLVANRLMGIDGEKISCSESHAIRNNTTIMRDIGEDISLAHAKTHIDDVLKALGKQDEPDSIDELMDKIESLLKRNGAIH